MHWRCKNSNILKTLPIFTAAAGQQLEGRVHGQCSPQAKYLSARLPEDSVAAGKLLHGQMEVT